MIAAIKRLFAAEDSATEDTDRLHMAGALLMLEVACADFSLGSRERSVLQGRLAERLKLADAELEKLVEQAMAQHDLSVSLHEQVALLNEHYDPAAKKALLRDLWTVAYADGELHHYEEAVIRRLADLLYVPHRDFILTKHQVTGQP